MQRKCEDRSRFYPMMMTPACMTERITQILEHLLRFSLGQWFPGLQFVVSAHWLNDIKSDINVNVFGVPVK